MSDLRHDPNRILSLANCGRTEALRTINLDTPGPKHDESLIFSPMAEDVYAPQVAGLLGLDTKDLLQRLHTGEKIEFFMPSGKSEIT